jgi:hypothetical protein
VIEVAVSTLRRKLGDDAGRISGGTASATASEP